MLTLPIKKKWFDMILSGEKKEEYREIKPYWTNRFLKATGGGFEKDSPMFRDFIEIYPQKISLRFRNGYSSRAPMIECDGFLTAGKGKSEWGAEEEKEYYIFSIESIKEM